MADLETGVGRFVAALTGARPAARRNAQKDAWEAGKSEAEARIKADEFSQREGLGAALSLLAGVDSDRGNALSTVMRGGFANFPQGTEGLADLADLAIQKQVLGAIEGGNPDVAKINQLLAARRTGGGPLSPQQTVAVPLGQALVDRERSQIAADMARAGASNAQAQASMARAGVNNAQVDSVAAQAEAARALAALRGRTDPNKNAALQKVEADLVRQGASAQAIQQVLSALNAGRDVNVQEPVSSPLPGIGAPITNRPSSSIPQSSAALPAQARARLKEGVNTTFANNQVWTIVDGVPTRVK